MNSPAIPLAFAMVAVFCASVIFFRLLFWLVAVLWYAMPWLLLAVGVVWVVRRVVTYAHR